MRVLVVDDAPETVAMVVPLLEEAGYEVASAGDGEEALRQVEEFAPDLVVLDLILPKIDGTEVCRRLRTVSDAYVIMLTSKSDEIDRVVGLSVGADDYVVKPFFPASWWPGSAPCCVGPVGRPPRTRRREPGASVGSWWNRWPGRSRSTARRSR